MTFEMFDNNSIITSASNNNNNNNNEKKSLRLTSAMTSLFETRESKSFAVLTRSDSLKEKMNDNLMKSDFIHLRKSVEKKNNRIININDSKK